MTMTIMSKLIFKFKPEIPLLLVGDKFSLVNFETFCGSTLS